MTVHTGTVLHVIPEDMARGAQAYARALVDELDGAEQRHLLLSLFRSGPSLAQPDLELDVPMGRLRGAGLHPLVLARLRRQIREIRPVAIVAHGGEAAKYVAVTKSRSMPMIYLMIGASHPKLTRVASRALYRTGLERSALVVTVSEGLAKEAEDLHGVDRAKILVIPNGRDEHVYTPGNEVPASPVRIGWVGHMEPAKRPELFVGAMKHLRASEGDVVGWMAGEGPLLEEMRAGSAGLPIDVLGARSDVPALLGSSHLLLFTGRPPEGLPGVLVEAAMCGLPVVTTSVPGASEVVVDGLTGIVVDVDDLSGLDAAVEQLVGDRALRQEMGHAARERAVRLFSLPATADKWRDAISGVVTDT